jgi:hypothetical protein
MKSESAGVGWVLAEVKIYSPPATLESQRTRRGEGFFICQFGFF